MKKTIKIIGLFALSAFIFSMSNKIQEGETINLDELIALNTVNAEDSGGSHTCYTIETGTSCLLYDCNDCVQKKTNCEMRNKKTCPTQ